MSYINTRTALFFGLACSSIALTACQAPMSHTTTSHSTTKTVQAKGEHKKAHWGYGEHGAVAPAQWGDMAGNSVCKTGKEQSPINVTKATKSNMPLNLKKSYQAENFTVKNNGHTVVFNATSPAKNKISVYGKVFELLQFHYHAPSEHQIMGKNYPLEIHFVHKSKDGQLAVVGVLYKAGADNAQLAKVADKLVKKGQGATLAGFDVNSIMPQDQKTLAYNGSLTTPPCSEKVQWLLQKTPVTASKGELTKFINMYKGNNRPVQAINGRTVSLN